MSKKILITLTLIFAFLICVHAQGEDRSKQGRYVFSVEAIEDELDMLISQRSWLSEDHYKRIEQSINHFEKQGMDVTSLKGKLKSTNNPYSSTADVTPEETKALLLQGLDETISADSFLDEGHYEEMVQQAASLKEQGLDVTEIERKLKIVKDNHLPSSRASTSAFEDGIYIGLQAPAPKDAPSPTIKFSVSPIKIENINFIEPMGELTDFYTGHIIPGAGIAIHFNSSLVDVYAMSDAELLKVERTPDIGGPYSLSFKHEDALYSCYLHLDELDQQIVNTNQKLRELYNSKKTGYYRWVYLNIPVKAGQRLGVCKRYESDTLGMGIIDTSKGKNNFIDPESYDGLYGHLYGRAPFEYFETSIKNQLYAKIPRKVEPRGGKIDFDIDGRLVGNWFKKGTKPGEVEKREYDGAASYWDGHLSFVYDYINPDQLRINVGVYEGIYFPCGVKGNSPDFKDIGVEDGMVTFEVVKLKDVTAKHGIRSMSPIVKKNSNEVLGVVLVKMLDGRTIKVEVFPGKRAGSVTRFTKNASIYTR